MLVILLSF